MKFSLSHEFFEFCYQHSDITKKELQSILQKCDRNVDLLIDLLLQSGKFDGSHLAKYIADQANCSYVDMQQTIVSPEALALIPKETAEKFCIIPLYTMGKGITVAMSNPFDEKVLSELRNSCAGLIISPVYSLSHDIQHAIQTHYQ